MRVSMKQLENRVEHLNELTNSPTEYWADGVINIGHYTLSGAYGGWELQRVMNTGGGVNCPLYTGHISKPKLYDIIGAYITGIEFGKKLVSDTCKKCGCTEFLCGHNLRK